jgi:hypothetical protein
MIILILSLICSSKVSVELEKIDNKICQQDTVMVNDTLFLYYSNVATQDSSSISMAFSVLSDTEIQHSNWSGDEASDGDMEIWNWNDHEDVWDGYGAVYHLINNLDATANSNDGSVGAGTPVYNSNGKIAGGLALDGASSVNFGNGTGTSLGNNISVSLWLYSVRRGGYQAPTAKWGSGNEYYVLNAYGSYGTINWITDGAGCWLSTSYAAYDSMWTKCNFVLDSIAGRSYVYFGGYKRDSVAYDGVNVQSTSGMYIGDKEGGIFYEKGYIDQATYLARTKTPNEILNDYLFESGWGQTWYPETPIPSASTKKVMGGIHRR